MLHFGTADAECNNWHPYYMKQKHEIRFKTELSDPDGGNLVTAAESCDFEIPFC